MSPARPGRPCSRRRSARASWVNWYGRSPAISSSWPKRASSNDSVTASVSVNVVTIPSTDSNVAAASVRPAAGRLISRGGRERVAAGQHLDPSGGGGLDLGHGEVLEDDAGDLDQVTGGQPDRTGARAVDGHALGGRRVAVGIGVLLLHEEPAEGVAGGVRRGDDALDEGPVDRGPDWSRRHPAPPRSARAGGPGPTPATGVVAPASSTSVSARSASPDWHGVGDGDGDRARGTRQCRCRR